MSKQLRRSVVNREGELQEVLADARLSALLLNGCYPASRNRVYKYGNHLTPGVIEVKSYAALAPSASGTVGVCCRGLN